MINWRSTTIHHSPRRALGLSGDEYTLLDWMYHTQGNEVYGIDGWCEIPYNEIAQLIGISKAGAFQMVDRLEKRSFIEVNPANPKRKRVTPIFFLPVYFDAQSDDEVGAVIVQKVNGKTASVQKVNAERSESERKRSESERQEKINKGNTKDNILSLREREETISPSTEESTWVSNSETRYQKALSEITAYLKDNPTRWGEIANEGRAKLDKAAFFAEVKAWLRWNADNWPVIQFPVKALTSGKSNFIGWLAGSKEKRSAPRAPAQVEGKNYRIHKREAR